MHKYCVNIKFLYTEVRSESLLTGSELSTIGSYCFPPDRPTHPLYNTCTVNTSFMQVVWQQFRTPNRKPFLHWFCGSRSPTINRHWFTVHSRQVVCTVYWVAAGLRPTTTVLYLYLSTGTYRPTQATPPLFLFRFPLPVTTVCCVLTGWVHETYTGNQGGGGLRSCVMRHDSWMTHHESSVPRKLLKADLVYSSLTQYQK